MTAIANNRNANVLEVVDRQPRQKVRVDLVVPELLLVLAEPKTAKPPADIHRRASLAWQDDRSATAASPAAPSGAAWGENLFKLRFDQPSKDRIVIMQGSQQARLDQGVSRGRGNAAALSRPNTPHHPRLEVHKHVTPPRRKISRFPKTEGQPSQASPCCPCARRRQSGRVERLACICQKANRSWQ